MANVMKNQEKGKKGDDGHIRDIKLALLEEFDPETAESIYDVLKDYPEKEWRTIIKIARAWIRGGAWGKPRVLVERSLRWLNQK